MYIVYYYSWGFEEWRFATTSLPVTCYLKRNESILLIPGTGDNE